MNSASLSTRLKRLYYHLNFIHLLLPMKFLLGFSAKTLQCCPDLCVLFLTHQFVKDLFPQYGSQQILHQFKNLRPLKMLIPISDQSPSHQLLARFLNPFPTNGFLIPSQKKLIPCNLVRGRAQALVYMLHKWYEAADKQGNTIRICLLDFSTAID